MSEKSKNEVELGKKDWGCFMRNIVPFIGIGATIIGMVVGLVILRRVETLRPDEILTPIITFDDKADADKQAPRKTGKGTADVFPRGDIGFSAHWDKEEGGYFRIEWELNRKNYEDRMRYSLYIELTAKEEELVSIALIDKNGVYTSTEIFEVSEEPTVKLIPFLAFNKYWKDEPTDHSKADETEFEWDSVTLVHLGPVHQKASDNWIYCEKMHFLFAE